MALRPHLSISLPNYYEILIYDNIISTHSGHFLDKNSYLSTKYTLNVKKNVFFVKSQQHRGQISVLIQRPFVHKKIMTWSIPCQKLFIKFSYNLFKDGWGSIPSSFCRIASRCRQCLIKEILSLCQKQTRNNISYASSSQGKYSIFRSSIYSAFLYSIVFRSIVRP